MKYPRISVITPSYNQASFVEKAIRSVVDQRYPNLEFMVIDGGSSDQTVDILKRYGDHIDYWVSEKDRGQGHALNKGLERVTGDIVGWLNSDDMYTPGAFEAVARAFVANNEPALVYGNRIMIDENDHVFGWMAEVPFHPENRDYTIASEAAFWSAKKAEGMRFNEDLRFAMDVDFFSRLYSRGTFHKLEKYLGYFRCHPASKSCTIAHVAAVEGPAVMKAAFGFTGSRVYSHTFRYRFRRAVQPLMHPWLVGLPYLHRRIFLGKRA